MSPAMGYALQWLWYLPLALLAVAAWRQRELWRVAFGVVVVLAILTTIAARLLPIFGSSGLLSVGPTIVEGSVFALAICLDRLQTADRDWVHWTGFTVYFIKAAATVASLTWSMMFVF